MNAALPVVQLPLFIGFFLGLRRMPEMVPDFATGGVLWFQVEPAPPTQILNFQFSCSQTPPRNEGRWAFAGCPRWLALAPPPPAKSTDCPVAASEEHRLHPGRWLIAYACTEPLCCPEPLLLFHERDSHDLAQKKALRGVFLRLCCSTEPLPCDGFHHGTAQDLGAPDPYMAFPIMTGVMMMAMAELGGESGAMAGSSVKMKAGMRGMALLVTPFTMNISTGVFVYWTTSNFYSILQTLAFKVRRTERGTRHRSVCSLGNIERYEIWWETDRCRDGYSWPVLVKPRLTTLLNPVDWALPQDVTDDPLLELVVPQANLLLLHGRATCVFSRIQHQEYLCPRRAYLAFWPNRSLPCPPPPLPPAPALCSSEKSASIKKLFNFPDLPPKKTESGAAVKELGWFDVLGGDNPVKEYRKMQEQREVQAWFGGAGGGPAAAAAGARANVVREGAPFHAPPPLVGGPVGGKASAPAGQHAEARPSKPRVVLSSVRPKPSRSGGKRAARRNTRGS